MELDRIRAWQLFIETARLGSLALAAEALSFPLPKASRLISSLEDELGFQLLDRTKKPAVLTAEGLALVLDAQGLISQWGILREKADALRKGNFDLSRRSLRISLPVNMDRSVFFDALQSLTEKHQGLQLEFCADVGQQALLEGKADIAWFGYKPEERGLVAIPMGYNVSFLVASAKYLKSHAEIKKVGDLINHPIIMRDTANESFSQILQCEFCNYEIGPEHKILYGDSDACKKLLIEGKGVAIDMNPNFIAEELLDGTVQPVLPGWHRKPWPLHICCRKSSSKDPIVREAMGIIRYLALHQEPNDWKSWYRRLHLPEQMVLLPKLWSAKFHFLELRYLRSFSLVSIFSSQTMMRQKMLRSKTLTGIVLAVAAGCFWGTMAVSGQYMITACGFNAEELTTVRIAGAGILMLVLGMLTEKNFFGSLRDLSVLRDVCFYGLCLFVIQYTFFLAIHACNAGTAAIMVGFGPIFIILWNILVKRQKIVPKEILAVIFAFVGVTLLITKGNFTSLSFSAMGIFWGLVSAGVGAFATIQPRRAIQKIGVTKVVSFGMFIGGILTCFMTPPWAISGHWTPMAIVAAVFVVVFGTVGAFWCYLRSTEFIPPALTSILASFEPLSAVVLCVLLLGTSFNYVECIGAALIISNLFILSIPNDKFRSFFPGFRRAGLEN